MNALKKTLSEQGADLKEDVKAKLMDQLAKLEKFLAKEAEEEAVVDEQEQA